MDLHRTEKKPEWEYIDSSQHNFWQRIAARTDGTLTPGNVMTVIGGIATLSGIADVGHGKTMKGLVKIGLGRLADVLDGWLANVTKTKSPKGEALDATIDKIEMAAALLVLSRKGILPEDAVKSMLGFNVGNMVLTLIAKHNGNEIHPSEEGKLAAYEQWKAIGLYGLAFLDNEDLRGSEVTAIADAAMNESRKLGWKAIAGYAQDALKAA